MKIAYLTNQYPHIRHTFIRREICALEGLGVDVARFSMRDTSGTCVDPADLAEHSKTYALLRSGPLGLLAATIRVFLTRPVSFVRGFVRSIRLGRHGGGVVRHWIYLAEACLLLRELQRQQIRHLHVHFATNPAAVALLVRTLGGPPYSITIHGPEEWDRPEALSLREKFEGANFVVAVSDFGRCQVYRWCGTSHWDMVHVVRCGVDESFLREEPTRVPETNRLILVAGLAEQKGHLLLLRALALVAQRGRDFEMLFVGDGPIRPLIEAEIDRLKLGERVRITGWKSNSEVRDLLQSARALVMPSFAENLPVAMMESLALGRPVVGTFIAGVPELIESGVNGWLVPAGNVEATATAIERILATPVDELTRMGLAGAALVADLHDVRKEAARMKGLFEEALSRSK
jgi:glycosyltransferase involved in cell wall biosynthesis